MEAGKHLTFSGHVSEIYATLEVAWCLNSKAGFRKCKHQAEGFSACLSRNQESGCCRDALSMSIHMLSDMAAVSKGGF